MTVADKILRAKDDYDAVHEAGKAKGTQEGYDRGHQDGTTEGMAVGRQEEYDAFWDGFQNKGARRTYSRAFVGYGWNFENFYPKYDIIIEGDGSHAFYAWEGGNNFDSTKVSLKKRLEDCGVKLDTSKATNLQHLFNYNVRITEIPTIDFTGTTSTMLQVFGNSRALTTIEKIITKESVTYGHWFINDTVLANVAFEGIIGQNIDFQYSPLLSKASIESIISHLSDTASGKTLTLSKTAVNNAFTDTEWDALEATKTNWTITLV